MATWLLYLCRLFRFPNLEGIETFLVVFSGLSMFSSNQIFKDSNMLRSIIGTIKESQSPNGNIR